VVRGRVGGRKSCDLGGRERERERETVIISKLKT